MCVSVRMLLLRDRHRAASGTLSVLLILEGCVARVDHRWAVTSFCYCHTLSAALFRSPLEVIKNYYLAAG